MGTVDLNDLGVLVAVVESKSFSRAAARLGLPKSSVSRAVARLEEAMGARMLHRTTRQVVPSTAGSVLYDKVKNEVGALRRSLGDLSIVADEPMGHLRVSAPLSIESFLAEVAARFVTRYRAVELELRLSNYYVDLIGEGIDLGLRYGKRLADSTLTVRRLGPASVALYATPSYLARRGTPKTPKDLERHEWVVYSRRTELRLEGGGRPVVVPTRGRIMCDDFAFLRAALVQGCGVGYLPPYVADDDLATGKLVRVLPRWQSPISHAWAVWPGGRKPPRKVEAFLELVVEAMQGRPL